METFLQRNRGEIGGLGKFLGNVPGSQNEVPYQILQKEKDYAEDLKAKYEAQVIAHTRTEKRIKELEKQLEFERRKLKTTNTELVRSLEEEKIARKSIESTLSKLKEDFARTDIDKDKLIMDLQVKYEKGKIEKSQFELELSKTREALFRSEQIYQNKISTLEDQVSRSQSLYVELDESTKFQIEKLRNEGSTDLSDIQKKYETALKKKDENLRTVMNEIEVLKSQISTLKTEALERKADEEIRMNEKTKEFSMVQRQYQDALSREQEAKLRLTQVHAEKLTRLQEDFKSEVEKMRQYQHKDNEQNDIKLIRARDERLGEQRESTKVVEQRNLMEQNIKTLNNELERLKQEKSDLGTQLKFWQDKESRVREQGKKEQESEVQGLRELNQSLKKRVEEMELHLRESR